MTCKTKAIRRLYDLVMNKAIVKASKVNEAELDAVAKMDIPDARNGRIVQIK
jgi:hypothetical protein